MNLRAAALLPFLCTTSLFIGTACGPVEPVDGEATAETSQALQSEATAELGPDGDAVWVASDAGLDPAVGRLRVTMVEVGQGDGFLVEFPNGKVLAVDGGPSKTRFEDYLRSRGITRIDYAVLSHGHDDHYAGLTPLLDTLPSDCSARVFDPGLERRDVTGYNNFRAAAGCHYQPIALGASLLIDPAVEVTVLSAYSRRFGSSDDSHGVNNTSVILRLRYGRFSVLFEGDAETTAERAVHAADPTRVRSTVLKAGHHGSCTSTGTSYLSAVAPQYVMISVSATNSYGMPHCQTMGKLRSRAGLRWLRTDVNGTVSFSSDGTRYAVSRSKGRESDDACPRDCAAPQDF